MSDNIYENLLYDILPEGLSKDRFEMKNYEIVKSKEGNIILYPNTVIIHLEEKHIPPSGYTLDDVKSKGFANETIVFDQPVRNKFLKLKIKRKRRTIKATGKVIKEELDIIQKGTRNTKSLGFFLKSVYRQILA